jgi:hypothetical protein
MSSYDTIDRKESWWVRVYCETPMGDLSDAVMLELGDRDLRRDSGERAVHVEYMTPDDAIALATALLNAAAKAKHQLKVDAVLEGKGT